LENKKSNGALKYILSFALLIILIVATYYVIFKNNDITEIWGAVTSCPSKWLLIIACFVVLGYLVCYALFALVPLSARGGKTSFGNCFTYACTDFFYAAITPSAAGGEPMVLFTMNHDGVPFSHSSLALVIQAMYNRGALLVYGVLALIVAPNVVFGVSGVFNSLIALGFVINIGIVVFCSLAMRSPGIIRKVGNFGIKLLAKIKIIKNKEKTLASFENQLNEYKASAQFLASSPMLGVKMFLACFAQRGCMFFAAYLVYACFGNSALNFVQVMCIQAIVCIVVDNIPLPGAMGANEWATGAIYNLMYNAPSTATAAMLLHRVLTFYYPLVISGVVSVVKYLKMVVLKKKETV